MPGLLVSQNCNSQVHLVVGSTALSLTRVSKSLECGADVILIAPKTSETTQTLAVWETEVQDREASCPNFRWIQRAFKDDDLTVLGRDEVDNVVDTVFVAHHSPSTVGIRISALCKRLRIPINVADSPELSTFTLLSTHTDGPLQVGVTTSGKGCRLASRIRREIVSSLPLDIAQACHKVGELKRSIEEEDAKDLEHHNVNLDSLYHEIGQNDDDAVQNHKFNELVLEERSDLEKSRALKKKQRIRWLSQVVEYYPFSQLAALSIEDLCSQYRHGRNFSAVEDVVTNKKGSIALVGSGPGAPGLLTTSALAAITTADLVLADKLVPAGVLDLIPRHVETFIAKKFPGNAEAAQEQLLNMGIIALKEGKSVVRLKQGDPYIFGRGAEEYLFFSKHGYKPQVIPGITSALSGPLLAAISPTHREVADQVLICTGTGRKGTTPAIPEYVDSRTTIFLMALHRLADVTVWLRDAGWRMDVPCAIIERASCPDQRVIRTTLEHVAEAFERAGSRPPGILVVGKSCAVIEQTPSGQTWVIDEGCTLF
ncbi:tetrapyrrole methylase [Lipomyces tetrasporus]|uniref:Tetrapyrrole methylase n=1 Tax=Lipomyces tetrasporus TaxID=54092 RepID=A0AAD7QTP1_9ASCO|nr:tetrapyrrole methylase [Lipomyces tetrasporus]KAJ8101103.1 tetrapyrrole methylase [Lipomyces tetrasporus]